MLKDGIFTLHQLIFFFSINQVRIRDTIADNLNTFEVHKLENIKVGIAVMGLSNVLNPKRDLKSGLIMRLVCESETEKNHWVKAINYEVKQLRTMAKNLSSQHFPLTHWSISKEDLEISFLIWFETSCFLYYNKLW